VRHRSVPETDLSRLVPAREGAGEVSPCHGREGTLVAPAFPDKIPWFEQARTIRNRPPALK